MSKEEHNEWVIKDNLFHRQVSNVRNTIHGNSEAAMRALELVKAKQQQAALAPLKPSEPGYAQPNYAQLASSPAPSQQIAPAAQAPQYPQAPASQRQCECATMTDEDLEHKALFDQTLPVYKFRYVLNRLRSELKRAGRYGHTTSVMIITIDSFSTLQTRFGSFAEVVQNEILVAGSKKFDSIIRRDIDLLGRYLNERFIVVLPETDSEQAAQFGERIRTAIETTTLDLLHDINFTVSLGIVTSVGDTFPAEELIMQADGATEEVEKRGGNGIQRVTL
ncbi:MAG: diguanylate cyclase [Leptolyngbya sp.]|nr:diguanylate cyclase [Candidatus Melainabacteria bacterium]